MGVAVVYIIYYARITVQFTTPASTSGNYAQKIASAPNQYSWILTSVLLRSPFSVYPCHIPGWVSNSVDARSQSIGIPWTAPLVITTDRRPAFQSNELMRSCGDLLLTPLLLVLGRSNCYERRWRLKAQMNQPVINNINEVLSSA